MELTRDMINEAGIEFLESEGFFTELVSLSDKVEKTKIKATARERYKKLGGKISVFDELYKLFEAELSVKVELPEKDYFRDGFSFYCGDWSITNDGRIYEMAMNRQECRACYHPIYIKQVFINSETNRERVMLRYCTDKWHSKIVDREVISSASKIVSLSSMGISVTSETAKHLVRWLDDMMNLNRKKIERKVSTSKMGWWKIDQDGKSGFMPYTSDGIEFDGDDQYKEVFNSIKAVGDYVTWLEEMKNIRSNGRVEPVMYMAASFSSVLVSKINALPFIVNLWSETGKGKTVALMTAVSIWADPSEGKYLADPNDTNVGFEVRCDFLNNLPLCIDDLSKVDMKNVDSFDELIYRLCSGRGKGRSNKQLGLERIRSWSNCILTNMERPITGEYARGGAVNRVLDFEMDPGSIFESGNRTVNTIKSNYGYAGRFFVLAVEEMIEKDPDAIQKLVNKYIQKINEMQHSTQHQKTEKQIIPMALIMAADEISERYIFQDGVRIDLEWCFRQLKNANEINENERAYDFILDFYNENMYKFGSSARRSALTGQQIDSDRREFYGGIKTEGKDTWLCIVPKVFNSIAKEGNFSARAFYSWAKKENILRYSSDKKQERSQWKVRLGDRPSAWYVAIKLPEEEAENVEKEDVPFNSVP